ncbi:MAG: ABC transporter ATP-binding protein [Gemmataceae bacterium]
MPSLRLDHLTKHYPGQPRAVDAVSLTLAPGELLTIVGPSGCGKTTLLRLIAGLDEATSGRVFLDDQEVTTWPPARRQVAMVFQHPALFPYLTVARNLAFGSPRSGERDQRIASTATRLGLAQLLNRYPDSLSGGERQRVALGRALVRRPALFLLDEPLTSLDTHLRLDLRRLIRTLQREERITTLHVTHDQEEALALGDRLAVMHQGRIHQVGTPQELHDHPGNRVVAGILGSPPMNFLDGQLDPHGRPLVLGFRPQSARLDHDGPGIALVLRVTLVEALGEHCDVTGVTSGGESCTVRFPGRSRVHEGECLDLRIPPEVCHWFEPGPQGIRVSP